MHPITIKIKTDFQKDLQNWLQAIQKKHSHGISWERFIPTSLKEKIHGKNEEDIAKIVEFYLKGRYDVEKNTLIQYADHLEVALNKAGEKILPTMARITEKPIYRDEFMGFITTFPRGPYDTRHGYIWMIFNKDNEWQVSAFIHELLHMQFEHYYKKDLLKLINEKQFEFLKESMTIINNSEFSNVTPIQDNGYPIHREFRKYLINLWQHRHDFNQFVAEATKHINDFQT